MLITSKQLALMGASPAIIDTWRAKQICVTWDRDGYRMDGVITARKLSAGEVLRFIAALQ